MNYFSFELQRVIFALQAIFNLEPRLRTVELVMLYKGVPAQQYTIVYYRVQCTQNRSSA